MNRSLKRAAIVIFAVCSLSLGLYAFRSQVLAGIASFWIVNEPLSKADAIMVLGGGEQHRPFEAARLYREGYAPRILVANCKLNPTDQLGLTTSGTGLNRRVLLSLGIPESAVVLIGRDMTNTYDEAVAVRDWVRLTGARKVMVVTDFFHTRRALWIFRKLLKSTGAEVFVHAVNPQEYRPADWWRHEEGLIAFQNEVIKFARYLIIY